MLQAANLTKAYNGVTALHPLNLAIQPGEIFCLLGANGAGKTTTINLFLNFIAPTAGTASIGGIDVESFSTSMPPMDAVPAVGAMKLKNRLMVVVLPAAVAPSRQKISPG